MAVVGWLEASDLHVDQWPDAPDEPVLSAILAAAFEQCDAYAPARTPDAPVTESLKLAQLLQAQHLWARRRAGNGDGFGAEGYMVQTYPLVMEARALLRPKSGNPFRGLV